MTTLAPAIDRRDPIGRRITARGPELLFKGSWRPEALVALERTWEPKTGLGKVIRDILPLLTPEQADEVLSRITRSVVLESQLAVTVFRQCRCGHSYEGAAKRYGHTAYVRDGKLMKGCAAPACRCEDYAGEVEDWGVVSQKVITTAGVGFLVDAWQNSVELEILRYHGLGTDSTAESASDTALNTELTTQYGTDNTRPTGSLTEGASANIFRTVGTSTVDATVTIAEHGIFSQAANSGGTLWDRSLTGGQALSSGDSLQTTYDMTASSGG